MVIELDDDDDDDVGDIEWWSRKHISRLLATYITIESRVFTSFVERNDFHDCTIVRRIMKLATKT